MSKTATLYQSANISGDVLAQNYGPNSFQLTNSPAEHIVMQLASGTNTVLIPQVPSPSQAVDIVPPVGAPNLWIMQSGDTTGVQISSTLPTRLTLSTSITSFVMRTSGSVNVDFFWY